MQQTQAGCKYKRGKRRYSFANYLYSWEGSSMHEKKRDANSEESQRNSQEKVSLKTDFVAKAGISGAPNHYGLVKDFGGSIQPVPIESSSDGSANPRCIHPTAGAQVSPSCRWRPGALAEVGGWQRGLHGCVRSVNPRSRVHFLPCTLTRLRFCFLSK